MRAERSSRTEGFTLVEVLVVIAIISTLAGLVLAGVTAARRFADQKATAQDILALQQAIESYNTARGDYPPSSLAALKVKHANTVDEGNRALLLSLLSRKKGGPYIQELKETRLNATAESLSKEEMATIKKELDPMPLSPRLLEYVDLWGNPFVYIHNRDYDSKKTVYYVDRDGTRVPVKAARSVKLGTFQSPNGYQIWSFGPNGKNENGEGDDIASWK